MTIVFSDVAGTIIRANPWDYIREHPLVNRGQLQQQLWRFFPVYAGKKLRIVPDTVFRHHWLLRMSAAFRGLSRQHIMQIYRDVVFDSMADQYHEDVVQV